MELARRTANYPDGARFVWNVEALWAADLFLQRANPAERREFFNAVRSGQVELNGMYLNELSALMPLTVATDSPPQQFWMDYSRELRHKIDARVESKFSWQQVVALLKPGYLTALATAATLIIALTFTLGGGLWSSKNDLPDEELTEALPVAENLDFFRAMDVLDELDLLEVMGNSANDAA